MPHVLSATSWMLGGSHRGALCCVREQQPVHTPRYFHCSCTWVVPKYVPAMAAAHSRVPVLGTSA
eukprot:7942515-Prorocentrum_lima.AAC.1